MVSLAMNRLNLVWILVYITIHSEMEIVALYSSTSNLLVALATFSVLFWCKPIQSNSLFYYEIWREMLWSCESTSGPWPAVYNNVQALVTLFLAYDCNIN